MAGQTLGERIFAVRSALGPNARKPLSQREFAALLNREGGTNRYDSSVVSRLETDQLRATLDDVALIASVDPLRRGREWLAWGEGSHGEPDVRLVPQTMPTMVTPEQMAEPAPAERPTPATGTAGGARKRRR